MTTAIVCTLILTLMLGTYSAFIDPERHKEPKFTVVQCYTYSFIIFATIFGLIHLINIFVTG